jgi:hypothetical protein
MRRVAVILSLLSCCSLAVPASADVAAEARLHDELAREHFRHRRYEAALREFFFEHRLAPNPRILFNIALSFDALRRGEDAFLFYSEYLTHDDDDAERRRLATDAVARLAPRVARVAVASDPEGAEVYVDRRDHGSYGRTPRLLVLAPGRHRLTIERAGYRPVELEVEAIRGREVPAAASLVRIVGHLSIRSPIDARVAVRDPAGTTLSDSEVAAGTPLALALPPGDYHVEVQGAGHEVFTELTRVSPEASTEVVVRPRALPPPTGDVTITSSAPGAIIHVDGEPVGFAPWVISDLSLGPHRVRLERAGLRPWEGAIDVHADERAWLTVSLAPPGETERSPATWVLGGVGIASIVAGAALGGFALANREEFEAANGPERMRLRGIGEDLNVVVDVLFGAGAVSLAVAVALFFATERTRTRESEGSVTYGER